MSEEVRTADEIITEYSFSAPLSEAWVLVEGESDVAFLWEFKTDRNCTLIDTQGKPAIEKVLTSPETKGRPDIVGIVDADYWLISQQNKHRLNTQNLLCDLECPDLEILLMSSRALKKSLRHDVRRIPNVTIPVAKIERFADLLATKALGLGMEIGYFRLCNENKNYRISFNRFWKAHQLDEFIDPKYHTFDRDWFARRLANHHNVRWERKPERQIPYDELLAGVAELENKYPMPNIKLCRGKDVVALAKIIGPSLLCSEFANDLTPDQMNSVPFENLSTDLRKSYEFTYFVNTSLYKRIRQWEAARSPDNKRYRIIRKELDRT